MSLTTQQWRYIGASSFAVATVEAVLNAIWALGTAAVYADGTTRTPGAGSAWTWSRYQNGGQTEAAYASPPTGTLAQRVIFAGDDVVRAPVMAAPDTWAGNNLLVGLAKNAGAYLAWDNAAPFTSGQFFGYWRCWATSAGTGSVYVYECQESILIVISVASTGNVYAAIAGAWIDPESTDTTMDAETDGRLYGIAVSGASSALTTTWWTWSTSNYQLFDHTATAGQEHCGVFTPGTSTIINAARLLSPYSPTTNSGLKTRSGRWGRVALGLRATAAAPNDCLLGRLREIFGFSDGMTPQKQTSNGATTGYIVASSTSASADALFLAH